MLFPLALSSPIYTLRNLYTLFVGFQWCTATMFEEFKAYDARGLGTRYKVPFFLFQGDADVITVTSLATDYFAEVEAPAKELALIKDAGHFAALHPAGPVPHRTSQSSTPTGIRAEALFHGGGLTRWAGSPQA